MDYSGHPQATTPQIQYLLHVLKMHGDDIIMSLLDNKLYVCLHKVDMAGKEADDVLRILKEKASVSDLVICEVDVDKGVQDWFKKLQSQVNIPLISVRPDSNLARVLNCTSDKCRYTPIGYMQYAVEKKNQIDADPQMNNLRITSVAKVVDQVHVGTKVKEVIPSSIEGATERKNISDSQVDMVGSNRPKKQRVIWTPELRRAFDDAVHKLGFENAVPKKILELMNWPGLTRENVASHLQKYRSSKQKQSSAIPMRQRESSFKRRKSTFNPAIDNNTMSTTDPFKLHELPEQVILPNPQLNIHGFGPSTGSFDNVIDNSYTHDDSISHISQNFWWDTQTDLQNHPCFEIENSQGGSDYESQRCLLQSDNQLYDVMSYKVPQCNTSQENKVGSNNGHCMNHYIAGLQNNSNAGNNIAQHEDELGGSYTAFPSVPNHVNISKL